MGGLRKAAAAIVIVAAVCAAGYLYLHSDYFGDDEPRDITVTINYPDAGTLSKTFETVERGDLFSVSVTPNNNGYTFVGWFEGNTNRTPIPLTTFTFLPRTSTTLTAWFSVDHDASFTATPENADYPSTVTVTSDRNVEIAQRSWKVTEEFSGEELLNTAVNGDDNSSFSLKVNKASLLSITQTVKYTDGETATHTAMKVVDDLVTKRFEWKFQKDSWYSAVTDGFHINNGSITWEFQLSHTWYDNALNSDLPRNGSGAREVIGNFVTSEDPLIMQMAHDLYRFTAGMDDIDRVNCVLKFAQQCFPYQFDSEGKYVSEYYKMPAEILWEGKGDCEDHAFLFSALMRAMGYDVVLYEVDCYDQNGAKIGSHLAAGVAVRGGSGYSETVGGKKYYYCEATYETGAAWFNDANVGYKPTGYEVVRTFDL